MGVIGLGFGLSPGLGGVKLGVTYGDEQTLTLQPDATAGTNAVINSGSGTSHNHTGAAMVVGEVNNATANINRIFMLYDLSALPSNALLTSVTLTLNCNGDFADNSGVLSIYRMKTAWTKTGVTWDKYDGVNNWPGGGGGFGSVDCEQTPIATKSFTASETLADKVITFTPTTKADLDLGYGWMLKTDGELNDGYRYATCNNATPENRPELIVKYRVPL